MEPSSESPARGEGTREALLDAATEVFARQGFHETSLRQISERADINSALIGYHFRSKEGLYLAVFERIAARMRERLLPIIVEIEQLDREPPGTGHVDRYLPSVLRLLDGMVGLMTQEASESWAQLITREQQFPTKAFDVLEAEVMRRVLQGLARLVQRIRPHDGPERARLLVATLIGQVLVIRVSRTAVMRLLNWEKLGPREIESFCAQIRRNATLLLLGD